jgi:glutamate synthase domain-containing protein 3
MSGGVAYVLDEAGTSPAAATPKWWIWNRWKIRKRFWRLHDMIQRHVEYTGSEGRPRARAWDDMVPKFVKVMPRDYKRVVQHIQKALADGLTATTP